MPLPRERADQTIAIAKLPKLIDTPDAATAVAAQPSDSAGAAGMPEAASVHQLPEGATIPDGSEREVAALAVPDEMARELRDEAPQASILPAAVDGMPPDALVVPEVMKHEPLDQPQDASTLLAAMNRIPLEAPAIPDEMKREFPGKSPDASILMATVEHRPPVASVVPVEMQAVALDKPLGDSALLAAVERLPLDAPVAPDTLNHEPVDGIVPLAAMAREPLEAAPGPLRHPSISIAERSFVTDATSVVEGARSEVPSPANLAPPASLATALAQPGDHLPAISHPAPAEWTGTIRISPLALLWIAASIVALILLYIPARRAARRATDYADDLTLPAAGGSSAKLIDPRPRSAIQKAFAAEG